ncbi:DNA N-glycosylase and apurinic/apyrimidinic (AP) lyase [Tulasnella sp. 424]|nr:DNA N-glycosylase and apurinic/apyrimidinic (AP) lyase [Tulasnella sp. 424]KAG8965825.1 DNA N-glycosylase and apurinic/apyrimidinic (AP) lyase [Tulasnella sp. 425]
MGRKRPALSDSEESTPLDLEDSLSPPPPASSKLRQALSGFAYNAPGPSTRSTAKRVKLEEPDEELTSPPPAGKLRTEPAEATPPKRKGVKKGSTPTARKPKPIQKELDVPHAAPPHWRETYDLIVDMRKNISAPVDTMGCASAMKNEENERSRRFGTLIALMLSSQTKDEVTTDAMNKLRSKIGELTVENVLATDDEVIQECICKVGFWRRKTGYIRQTAQKLKDEFESDVPQTVDELCSLPGVGPKMAYLTLQVAWNLNLGIGVDVHVHRITNRLGWHKPPTTTPEQTRLNLQSWLPKELHGAINPLLVGFGQVICQPVGPKCDSCVLSSRGLCPSAVKVKAKAKAKGTPTKAKTLKRSLTEVMKEEGDVLERIDPEDEVGTLAFVEDPPDLVGPAIKLEPPT